MKYNTEDCYKRMVKVLGKTQFESYQAASEKYRTKAPVVMDEFIFSLSVLDCMSKILSSIEFEKYETNDYRCSIDKQTVENIEYFQKVYKEDIKGE